jgi:hypothetical protein
MYADISVSLCTDNTQNNFNDADESNLDIECNGILDSYLTVGSIF